MAKGLHGGPNDSGIDAWSTGPLARPFARSLAPLTRSLARSLRSLPRSWESEFLMSQNDLVLSHSAWFIEQSSREFKVESVCEREKD